MNVLLVSQCSKRALVETRRVLDQFAERRGDRVWQTAITQQGLDTLRKMLKKMPGVTPLLYAIGYTAKTEVMSFGWLATRVILILTVPCPPIPPAAIF
ncbi:hypothetical protein WKW49_13605 [Teredinibacter turnerae]